jgi:pyridoxine 4-dehydrogenase
MASEFVIGGELRVRRLAFGAMRLPGMRDLSNGSGASRELLREVVALGANLIDTAHIYGRSEELIAEALHPYPEGLVIATKGGLRRGGLPDGRPERLRADCEESLRRLRLEVIDLWQLHDVDRDVPFEEQLGTMRELRDEGKIRFVGISNVSAGELRQARELIDIATVQNRFNLAEGTHAEVLQECESAAIGFMPFAPIGMGELAGAVGAIASVARRHGATTAQIALAWLLARSPAMLPIPGTGSLAHLRENMRAARIELSAEDRRLLDGDAADSRGRARDSRGPAEAPVASQEDERRQQHAL